MLKKTKFFTQLKKSLTFKVLINTGWASAAAPVNFVLGIIQVGMLARMLGPDGIGQIALFTAVCALFTGILKLTSSETVMVYASRAESQADSTELSHIIRYCYLCDALTSVAAFLAVVLSSFFIASLFNLSPEDKWLQMVFGLTIIFQSAHWTAHSLLRLYNHFSWIFYQSCAHSIVKVAAITVLFFTGAGLNEVVYLLVALSLFDGMTIYIMSLVAMRRKKISMTTSTAKWWQVSSEVRRFQILGHGRQIIKSMNRYIDILLIGHIAPVLQVGYYRAGKQISKQIRTPAQGFLVSLFPEYSRLYFSGDMAALRKIVKRFAIMLLTLALSAAVVLWFGAEWVIRIILGQEFLPAVNIVRILIISSTVLLAMYPVYSLPAAVGRAGPAIKAVTVAIFVQVIMILFLVPRYGVIGAAWANVGYVLTWSLVLLPSIFKVLSGSAERPLSSKKAVAVSVCDAVE